MAQRMCRVHDGDVVVDISVRFVGDQTNCGITNLHSFRATALDRRYCLNDDGSLGPYGKVSTINSNDFAMSMWPYAKNVSPYDIGTIILEKWVDEFFSEHPTTTMSDRVVGGNRSVFKCLDKTVVVNDGSYRSNNDAGSAMNMCTADLMYLLALRGKGAMSLSHVVMNTNHRGYSGIQVGTYTHDTDDVLFTTCAGTHGFSTRGRVYPMMPSFRDGARAFKNFFSSYRKGRR